MKKTKLFFKGILMGIADVIPGVSGGTMALILNIYDELISSIRDIQPLKFFQTVRFKFFIPLGAGMGLAIFLFSHVIETLLTSHKGPTYAFFFGLILASVVHIVRSHPSFHWGRLVGYFLFGAVGAYLFVGLNPLQGHHGLWVTFGSGMIAIMAMLLPGISGSFLLLILGQYEYIIGAIKDMALGILFVFAAGAAVGALAFSRVLYFLLKNYKAQTLAVLVGGMTGALRLPWGFIEGSSTSRGVLLLSMALGMALVFSLEMGMKLRSRK